MLESHARETADAFGLGRAISLAGPVARGRMGAVWRLDTERGSYAVKVADEPPDPAEVERTAAAEDAFAQGGVPMPAVVRAVDGSVLAEVGGRLVRAHTWVDVAGPDRGLDPAAVGRLLAGMHRVRLPATGPVGAWWTEPVGADGWAAVVAQLRLAGAPYAERLAAYVPGLLDAETLIEPADPGGLQVCHRDLWADNLRAGPGGPVALDWDHAGPASPTHELAQVVLEFADGEPARARALVTAYAEAGGPARLTGLADFSMLLAVQGHLVVEGCRRWLAAATDADRADNEAWVAEFLDEPWLEPQLVALLDAVS